MKGYVPSNLVKLDILINHEEIDALSFILHADTAYEPGAVVTRSKLYSLSSLS